MQNKTLIASLVSCAIGFLLCLLLLKGCGGKVTVPQSTQTIRIDTAWLPGKDSIIEKIVRIPYPVSVEVSTPAEKSNNFCDSTRYYYNITPIDSSSFFVTEDSVVGKKLWSRHKYKGKPYFKVITKTVTDSIPYKVNVPQSGFYLSSGIGTNLKVVDHLYVGADYVTGKKFAFGYAYDVLQKTHNGFIRYRIY